MNIFISEDDITDDYFVVTYYLEGAKSLEQAAWDLAVGQSASNPRKRCNLETDQLIRDHCCKIVLLDDGNGKSGYAKIAFPLANINFNTDSLTHLFTTIAGGQTEIDEILKCHVVDIDFPQSLLDSFFNGPKFGITGIREKVQVFDKPLWGAILKPKCGLKTNQILDIVKELVDNECRIIKEDEIQSDPDCAPFKERVVKISEYLHDKNVIYYFTNNGKNSVVLDRAKFVAENGGCGIHMNFWHGYDTLKDVREADLPLFIHYQTSGHGFWSDPSHRFHIDWNCLCKLAALCFADQMHIGMLGGYHDSNEEKLVSNIKVLRSLNSLPVLSCGAIPGLVDFIVNKIGNDCLINCGASVMGFPDGFGAGCRAMEQAVNKEYDGLEYKKAIELWGYHA